MSARCGGSGFLVVDFCVVGNSTSQLEEINEVKIEVKEKLDFTRDASRQLVD